MTFYVMLHYNIAHYTIVCPKKLVLSGSRFNSSDFSHRVYRIDS